MKKEDEDRLMDAMEDTKRYAAGQEAEDFTNEETGENDITPGERALLDKSFEDDEERQLHEAELDDTDNDGTFLNEKTSANSVMGDDLDVPGSEDDNANEEIGEEDEENNSYSLSDQDD